MTDWSIRAGVFLENVMDTMQQADELGGIETREEYARAMVYVAFEALRRADKALALVNEEGKK